MTATREGTETGLQSGKPCLFVKMACDIRRLTNKSEIRLRLNTDRDWSLYALADLDEEMFEHCEWTASGASLALVFRALAIRPIFVLGDAVSTRKLLAALPERTGYLNLQPHQLDAAEGIYYYHQRHQMLRMFLDHFDAQPATAEPLNRTHQSEIERLYSTGDGGGIAFAPFQLDSGFFRGIRRNGDLVAVAGVQVASRNESVAAIGNVFTRPDCRGMGLAQMVTYDVVKALTNAHIETIGLNVEHTNAAAIHVYERLGFRARFHYFEGVADRL